MITTKYNFRQYIRRKYPDISITPVYGIPAYLLSKELDKEDSYLYNLQQLPSGQYVVFIGIPSTEIIPLMKQLKEQKIPLHRKYSHAAPTTFASFENWLITHSIVYKNRTFCSRKSASQLLMTDKIHNCTDTEAIKTWYMYELPLQSPAETGTLTEWETEAYSKIPYIVLPDTVVCLIKASNSMYKSKKQLFKEKFSLMQPLYEQLISVAVRAQAMDEVRKGSGDWEKVKQICEQYMSIQFEREGTIDIESLKEALNENVLGFWVRDRSNFLYKKAEGFEMDDLE